MIYVYEEVIQILKEKDQDLNRSVTYGHKEKLYLNKKQILNPYPDKHSS